MFVGSATLAVESGPAGSAPANRLGPLDYDRRGHLRRRASEKRDTSVAFSTTIPISYTRPSLNPVDEAEDKSNRTRAIMIILFVCAFTGVSIAVYLLCRPHNRHLEPTPYEDIISQLRPNMSERDVLALFKAHSQDREAGEFAVYPELDGDGTHNVVAYRNGKDEPLEVRFSVGDRVRLLEWCYSGQCHDHVY